MWGIAHTRSLNFQLLVTALPISTISPENSCPITAPGWISRKPDSSLLISYQCKSVPQMPHAQTFITISVGEGTRSSISSSDNGNPEILSTAAFITLPPINTNAIAFTLCCASTGLINDNGSYL